MSGPRLDLAKPSGFAETTLSALRLQQLLENPSVARAQADESPKAIKHVEKIMKKKYGAMFYIFGFAGRTRGGEKYATIKIQA